MANWISTKLKVAESLLQQIDQQAAESLGKNEKPPSPTSSSSAEISKKIDSAPPLRYQLPKKSSSPTTSTPAPPPPPENLRRSNSQLRSDAARPDPAAIDWTELLSSPNPVSPSPSRSNSKKKAAISTIQTPEPDKNEEADLKMRNADSAERSMSVAGSEDEESGWEDSSSGSDSEEERRMREERRVRREKAMAERAAAAAAKAIKEKEDVVARLEGEKQSLEKILEERAKQQAQEASELQMNMIETMEAVELEKQKHNSTRMEALACLAKLETSNAELARLLATTQWNLEVEVNRISELRQKIDLKEQAQEEHRRRILKIHENSSRPSKEGPLRKTELEQEIIDAEYSFICTKISQLKEKAKKLEENIENTKREKMHPTEVEVELKRRLSQLTDHLIQKQTQVEALSSEKATMVLRIEMTSRLLDESGVTLQATDASDDAEKGLASGGMAPARFDIEAAMWHHQSKSMALHEKIKSGRRQLGSLLQQLDAIFSAGYIFLRRNPMAQLWSLFYILCLHIWVMYILMSSHSQVASNGSSHGAVYSLETINKTSGL